MFRSNVNPLIVTLGDSTMKPEPFSNTDCVEGETEEAVSDDKGATFQLYPSMVRGSLITTFSSAL
jgi:hypothetical protein